MHNQNQKGFTLIEIILFFALSGAFLLIAFVGISGRAASVQFTDSMRSLHSYLNTEQDKVMNGVNSSEKSACDATIDTGKFEDCILVGRVVSFSNNSSAVTTKVIHGETSSSNDFIDYHSDIDKLKDSKLKSDGVEDSYVIAWDTQFNIDKSLNDDSNGGVLVAGAVSLGWLRSPDSSRLTPVVLGDAVDLTSDTFIETPSQVALGPAEVDAKLCFRGANGQVASINFDKNSTITLEFDDGACQ